MNMSLRGKVAIVTGAGGVLEKLHQKGWHKKVVG
jgi:hypothetical protein